MTLCIFELSQRAAECCNTFTNNELPLWIFFAHYLFVILAHFFGLNTEFHNNILKNPDKLAGHKVIKAIICPRSAFQVKKHTWLFLGRSCGYFFSLYEAIFLSIGRSIQWIFIKSQQKYPDISSRWSKYALYRYVMILELLRWNWCLIVDTFPPIKILILHCRALCPMVIFKNVRISPRTQGFQ